MVHLLMKNAGRLELIAENRRDFVLWGGAARADGSYLTPVDKGKTEVTP
jgi:hypothetical protein